MTKGTASFGKRNKKNHGACRRCNRVAFHFQKHRCASCGYPSPKIRKYNWAKKAIRKRTTGTGRMRHLKQVQIRFKNGFREGEMQKKVKQAPQPTI
ncbi:hypothetical protein HZS_6200 [Henneguya salminicola]|nr:hypothetical protein HZS_6200 [Henneguya salminicola]